MKNRFMILLFAGTVSMLFLASIVQSAANGPAGMATITGKITAASDGSPLSQVHVVSQGTGEQAFTNAAGEYTLTVGITDNVKTTILANVPSVDQGDGNHYYLDKVYGWSANAQEATVLTLSDGETQANIDIALDKKPTISGTVRAKQGGQYISSTINVYKVGTQVSVATVNLDCTASPADCANGYSLMVEPGDYFVKATTNNSKYASQFYDNKLAAEATTVTVKANQAVSDVNFMLEKGGIISGNVYDKQGNPSIQSVMLTLYSQQDINSPVAVRFTDPNDAFMFQGLDAGVYYLYMKPSNKKYSEQFYGDTQLIESATAITVAHNSTTTLNVPLTVGRSLEVAFTDLSSGELITTGQIDFSIRTPDGNVYPDRFSRFSAFNGKVTIQGVKPGVYYPLVETGFGSDYATMDYYHPHLPGHTNTDPFTMTGEMTQTITFTLRKVGQITGTISAEGGDKLQNQEVRLYIIDEKCGGRILQASIYTDQNGNYIFPKVAPFYTYEIESGSNTDAYGRKTTEQFTIKSEEKRQFDLDLPKGGELKGTLTAEGTNAPLENVHVQLYEYKMEDGVMTYLPFRFKTTGSDGTYSFTGLDAGDYYLTFAHSDYVAEIYDDVAPHNLIRYNLESVNPTAVSVSFDQTTIVDETLTKRAEGSIEGWVYGNRSGRGLDEVSLYLYLKTADGMKLVDAVHTNIQGIFKFNGVADGEYYLNIKTSQLHSAQSRMYKSIWYGGTETAEGSTTLTIASGAKLTGVAAGLDIGATISGKLSQPAFSPRRNLAVPQLNRASIFDKDGKLLYTQHAPNGEHTFAGLWPGTYYVRFEPYTYQQNTICGTQEYKGEWYDGKSTFSTATPIKITGTEAVKNIDGELKIDNNSYIFLPVTLR